MIISNSSPIIVLGKLGRLDLLKKCCGTVIVPAHVRAEILKKEGAVETLAFQKAVQEKWVLVERVSVHKNLQTSKIGKGEKEAISLAHKKKLVLLLDDDVARSYASMLNVEAHGTLFILYRSHAKKIITKNEAKHLLDTMISQGFYLSTEVYARFIETL
ncbi:hypothetical protein CMO91_00400 [Candidatus Woesearchaeota archaeon]|nr:hypothetical protein [Candidatus Woesearchaeota archaeon]|tara:strand:+ start:558 stop:1034 length:477 start_codon:yes stop_codon:yes gene_type:complete